MTDKQTSENESVLSNLDNALVRLLKSDHLPDKYKLLTAPSDPSANKRFKEAREYLDLLPSRVLIKQQIDDLESDWKKSNFRIVLDRIQHLRRYHS
ncbi:hypothetical protein [Acetobacter senegalensis]|uniref:hypothetical protein n=1 Tax=Acetobacter senegalensis TaxID=446692 RepID=UPI002656BD2D|nr:hypothetical protein [Acetobacter senegalensis]MDN7351966.1 hypothetical protein [Acetobacter senegalensis]